MNFLSCKLRRPMGVTLRTIQTSVTLRSGEAACCQPINYGSQPQHGQGLTSKLVAFSVGVKQRPPQLRP